MARKTEKDDMLDLVTEVYASIVAPERFVDVLELWDHHMFDDPAQTASKLAAMERQIGSAVPLVEISLQQVINRDELVNRIMNYDRPSLLIAPNCLVLGANASGSRRFNLYAGDQLKTDLLDNASRSKFRAMLEKAKAARDEGTFQVIHFPLEDGTGKVTDHVVAVKVVAVSNSGQGYLQLSTIDLVLPDESLRSFKDTYDLTDAEMRILVALLSGRRQKDVARQLGIREDTVKKHIRQIRDKTETSNTTALVCLAASFGQISMEAGSREKEGARAVTVTNKSNQTYVMPNRHRIARVGGLAVEYAEFGDPSGKPLMLFHSTLVGFVLPPEFINPLVQAGYRVIIPFRPGNGVSSPLATGYTLKHVAQHLIGFADALGIDRFSIVGGTTGFTHGANVAALAPKRVECLVGIGAYLPVDFDLIRQRIARYQRGILYTLKYNRKLAKFLVLSGYKLFLQMGPGDFMGQIMKNSASDCRVLENAGALGLLDIGLRIAAAQGVDAVLNDSTLILSPWADVPARISCPIHLLHGDDDSMFSFEVVEEFCNDHPAFSLTKVDGTGQLMIFSEPASIARMVLERLPKD